MHVWRTHTVLYCRLTWLFPGIFTFASLLLLALSVPPVQAATSAGQEIINRATLSYTDTYSGEQVDVESNTSRIRVAELRRFSLTADQSVTASAGQDLVFSHTLTNTGNVPDGYFASAANVEADQGDLVNLQLTLDANGNGQVDHGEPLITDAIELGAGESRELLLSGRMPTDIGSGDQIELLLQVSSTDSTLESLSNRDTIATRTPANLVLGLTNTPQCTAPVPAGESVNYELELINSTQTLPVVRDVLVDGVLRSGVLVEIPVPEGMQLVRQEDFDSSGYESRALVRHTDNNGDSWMSMEAWPGSSPGSGSGNGTEAGPRGNPVNLLGVLLPATVFARDERITLRYEFTIEAAEDASSATASLEASAFIDLDADKVADARSNTVCNTRLEPAAALPSTLRFVQPVASVRSAIETLEHGSDDMFEDALIYWLNNDKSSVLSALADVKSVTAGIGRLSDTTGNGYDTVRDGVYIELATRVSDRLQLVDDGGVAHVAVELGSRLSNDTLIVLLKETSAGSDVYRSMRPVMLNTQVEGQGRWCPDVAVNSDTQKFSVLDGNDTGGGNCILLSSADDTLVTRYSDPFANVELSDTALVSPSSRVFDTASLAMVSGAEITVYDGDGVALAADGETPLQFISDENGRYFLPRMNQGSRYTIDVVPPAAYRFPSQVPPERFDAFTISQASYGATGFQDKGDGRFSVSVEGRAPILDIPLDPADFDSQLLMEKRVLQDMVELGDSVQYEIELTNQGSGELHDVFLIDTPPAGFRLVPASLMLNGQRLPEPRQLRLGTSDAGVAAGTESTGTTTAWQVDLGTLAASDSATVTYHLQATPLALHGDGVNSALANATTASGLPVSSNLARAAVRLVRSGVMSERAVVFGKVYVDSSCDRLHNLSEWPIGGVKLYLQDGSFVVTDEDGQFSFYGLRPGLQVIKLDTLTLPEGLSLKTLDNRHAADADSRFLDLSEGDFHRADFATYCPELDADGVFDRLAQRNQDLRGSWLIEEASRFNPDGKVRIANDRQRAGADGDLSSGLLGDPRTAKTDRKTSRQRTAGNARASMGNAGIAQLEADVLPASRPGRSIPGTAELHAESSKMGTPQELVAGITEEQADAGTWLWPDTEFSTDGRFMAVVRAGAYPVLFVNDVAISDSQIGERIANRRERAELIAWYGVSLKPGLNDVQVRGRDGFGNERILASGTFKRPAAGVRMMLRTRQDTLPADGGRTMLPIDVVINDANGYPANGVYFVTLETTDGDFLEQDLQVAEPGVQVRIEGGRGKIHIRSSELPGRMRLNARAGNMEATLNLVQVAAARPLVGAGLIELGGRWSRSGRNDASGIELDDGFELQARSALFLKGRVRKDMKLTLSYDSDKQDDTELLRDINPNEHYPTLGDASVRGFEAQSRSKLYAKLERDRHSVMWGDYLTDSRSEADNLARVQRTLTGFNGIYNDDRQLLQVFAARQSDVRSSEEIRGNGTALLYRLDGAPLVANSEIIERIVRDRENPGLVVSSERLQRLRDYTIDSVTGLLSFSDVVPSVDADLNPVSVRVSYDRKSDQDEYTLAGVRWQYQVNDGLSAGLSLTDDQNPLSGYTLAGVHASAMLGLHTTATVSAARMRHRDSTESPVAEGRAQSARLEHLWDGSREHRTTMNWARASAGFTSRDAGVSAGREEWQLEHHQPLSTTLRVTAKASLSASTTDATRYGSAGLRLDKSFATWSLNGGARRIWSSDGNRTIRFNTLGLGAERRWQLPAGRTFSLGVDAERDVADASRFRYGLDSRLQLFPHVSLYARHEYEQGLSQQSLNGSVSRSRQWVLGIESDVLPSTQVYSEYRMKGSYTGRSMESASGIRGRYEWRPGLLISPALEIIDVVSGQEAEDSVAVSLGISDTRSPNLRASAQAEMRESGGHRYLGFRASVAQRLNLDWTSLVREEYTRSIPVNGELTARHQFTLGLARRPKLDNRHHAVFLANWKQEYGPGAGEDKRTYLLSTHQNRQLDKGFTLSGRLGHKWQSFEFDSGDVKTQASVSDVRLSLDLDRRWEVDLRAGWLGAGRGANRYSLGAGVSWIVDRNIRLGLAYNVTGFDEPDLDVEGLNQQGVQFGLQVKFDEDWFQWLSD